MNGRCVTSRRGLRTSKPTAAADERIQLLHPDRTKKAPAIRRDAYVVVRRVALATLPTTEPGMTWTAFRDAVSARLPGTKGWDESLNTWWYTSAVKLDLEARGEIERLGSSPQRLRRV